MNVRMLSSQKEIYIKALEHKIKKCKRCSLAFTRRNPVVGEGNLDARIMFIGEAPGEQEDIQGKPFVGKSGQLLTKIIQAMGLSRDQVYIANILKCHPPGNRDPYPQEIENCLPYLFFQIEIINPEILVLLGRIAGIALFGPQFSITKMHGQILYFRGRKVIASFHPAYLLLNPKAKKLAWEDMKKVLTELNLPIPGKK
ncbi:MAG TPA: uracil-DNA glycosylase [Candidatus Omnitrophica bacterium]|nr:MAG: uracil-DNA glycosylase [Spirochaetota bacterium]HDI46021.1 uracil-DNA glycosylase [Candidatus Omnitrophota bacterium]